MKLFVGLGNPGGAYAGHRHNIGYMAADRIAGRHGFGPWRGKFQGQISEGRLDGEKCLLLKPATYMNESGRAAGAAARFYKLAASDIIVFYDEIDLAPGKVRVKTGGGAAGHNGIRSLINHVGADFTRVRLGVGHPGSKNKVQSYVLRDFSRADREWLEPLLEAIADTAAKLARDDAAGFMNAVALATRQEEPPAAAKKSGGGKQQRKAPASESSPARPSQRDLARRAAESARESAQPHHERPPKDGKPKDEEESHAASPFARLRKLFGGGDA